MVVQAEWYKDWFNSPYYHKLYFERNEQQAQEFINRLIQKIHPATGSRILEVGCGKGRYSKVFARLGLHVTAIDLALDNILEAKKTETDHLHFFQHDMRLPFWINYFDYAFNLFTSFGYFKSERENENAIRTMSLSLKPRAMLVLDYLNVHFAENHLVHKAEREIDGVLYILTKWFDESHFYKKVEIELEDMEEPLVYIERVAKFSLGDFTDMFAFHNLQIQEVYGDYHFSDYDVVKSPRMIMIAKKLTR